MHQNFGSNNIIIPIMGYSLPHFMIIFTLIAIVLSSTRLSYASSINTTHEELDVECPKCEEGYYCLGCVAGFTRPKCIRNRATDQFKLLNNSLPLNKYAFLTTHNSFAIDGEPSHTGIPRVTFTNQEDNITQQLQNGVRALMLDVYDFKEDIWLCHSFGGKCHDYTAFVPALGTLKEIEAFMSSNPNEIVTLILEDYVQVPQGLTKLFKEARLSKYWFPVSGMPKLGRDWPFVSDLVAKNQRLLVFTSVESKEESEGVAYQWNYMVENQYGDGGRKEGSCPNRGESSEMKDTSKSLVLVNYFRTLPLKELSCVDNSAKLMEMARTCHGAAGNRWANFLAVDYYKRSEGGGAFQAVDLLNGQLLCGHGDVHDCLTASSSEFKYVAGVGSNRVPPIKPTKFQ